MGGERRRRPGERGRAVWKTWEEDRWPEGIRSRAVWGVVEPVSVQGKTKLAFLDSQAVTGVDNRSGRSVQKVLDTLRGTLLLGGWSSPQRS